MIQKILDDAGVCKRQPPNIIIITFGKNIYNFRGRILLIIDLSSLDDCHNNPVA